MNNEPIPTPEIPVYQCHKRVRAFKITEVADLNDGHVGLHGDFAMFALVPMEYFGKHAPQVGGYYVLYDDGYESFSPAKAFEDGYHRVHDGVGMMLSPDIPSNGVTP